MLTALGGSVGIVAYLALFSGIGFTFVFVNLLLGRFLRPSNPHEEKLEIYECGEPTIGSSFVQFDLRFYVVALIFIIFDVEVAFLFPWATVFGKADQLAKMPPTAITATADDGSVLMNAEALGIMQELGVRNPTFSPGVATATEAAAEIQNGASDLLMLASAEVLVFFLILLIAFAYEWKIGALDWVRAITEEFRTRQAQEAAELAADREAAISA
ncbi:MAG: NADH-quinone oxidoreductase subunit A [Planctomycetota bacterium]